MKDTTTDFATQESWRPLSGSVAFWQTATEAAEVEAATAACGLVLLEQQLKTKPNESRIADIGAAWPDASAALIARYEAAAERAAKIARQEAARACRNLGLELSPESAELADAPTIADKREKPTATAGEWHAKRARRLAQEPEQVQAECGQTAVTIECGCQRLAVPAGCGRPQFCDACATRKRARLTARVKRSVRAMSGQTWLGGRRGPGRRLEWYLMTFTMGDSGDPEADRRHLAAAFNRWRAWLYNRNGVALPYCLAWEVTPGGSGTGHVHAHALMRLPFLPYTEAAEAWSRATGGRAGDNGLDFGRRDANGKPRRAPNVHEAARYVAKYIAKGASKDCSAQLLARWYCAQYARRTYSASRGFWEAKKQACACATCGVVWQFSGIIDAPKVLKLGDATTVARQLFNAIE